MNIGSVCYLRGPNLWARCTVIEVEVEVPSCAEGHYSDLCGAVRPDFLSLRSCHVVEEDVEGKSTTSTEQSNLAHFLAVATIELQRRAGSPVFYALVRQTAQPGYFRVICEYEEEPLASQSLEIARRECLAFLQGHSFDLKASLQQLMEMAHDIRLGPSTAAIVRAAQRRNIPFRRLNSASLVQLGLGAKQRRILTAETDATSAIAEAVAQDKQLTRSLLQAVGVPVPEGSPVTCAEEAWEVAQDLGSPVVVKPQFGNHGRGVGTNLITREQVLRAYEAALEESSSIVVERFIPGVDFRLLVVGDKLVAAALREPAQVVGDGSSTIADLVREVNRDPRRSDGHATSLSWIKLDAVALSVLKDQGFIPDSVAPAGTRVLIRRNGNLSTGGTATDVTDQVHPEVAARAIEAARVVGLDIAGVDIVASDIGRALEVQGGAIVEVNAGPGLRMHLEPSSGSPRPVGEAIVASLFPEGETGRIPIVAVTGVNGKTTTTRLISYLFKSPDLAIGMTCSDGIFINGRRIDKRDCSGPRSARAVLGNPCVQMAVLETARYGILREGLGFDYCNVAVVTNIGGGDHLGTCGIETADDLARVKRIVVRAVAPNGTAVLNAADERVAAMAADCQGRVLYFSRYGDHPVLTSHRRAGERVTFVRDSAIVLAQGDWEEELVSLSNVPATRLGKIGFQVDNVLAATSAAWCLGLSQDLIRKRLQGFVGDASQVPGRFNVFNAKGATVIVDFAHNASALGALVDALSSFGQQHRTLVFSGCNRRDEHVIEMGEVLGSGFDRVLLYPDRDNNNRQDGELNLLLRKGLANGKRLKRIDEASGEMEAVRIALDELSPDNLLILGVESLEEVLQAVGQLAANS